MRRLDEGYPLRNFKAVNAMIATLTQDDVDNDSNNFRSSVDIMMSHGILYLISVCLWLRKVFLLCISVNVLNFKFLNILLLVVQVL